jgi:hypothetical protein
MQLSEIVIDGKDLVDDAGADLKAVVKRFAVRRCSS